MDVIERRLKMMRSGVVGDTGDDLVPPIGVIADFIRKRSLIADSIRERSHRVLDRIGRRWGSPDRVSPDLVARAANDHLPLPDVDEREGYYVDDHVGYWSSGLEDYDKVVRAASEFSVTGTRMYDFGGSTGRVFRHFYCQNPHFEVWTSDFKLRTYLWNQRYMPSEICVFLNSFVPSLPLPDRYCDIVTAFSVFTHIDELESAWLLELRRVLRPGGLLYVTIHDETFWEHMPKYLLEVLQESANGEGLRKGSPFPGPRTAFSFPTADSYYSCNVFHSVDYVRQQWQRYFDILDVRPRYAAGGKQCVVLLSYRE